jgi:hypothetical protein
MESAQNPFQQRPDSCIASVGGFGVETLLVHEIKCAPSCSGSKEAVDVLHGSHSFTPDEIGGTDASSEAHLETTPHVNDICRFRSDRCCVCLQDER